MRQRILLLTTKGSYRLDDFVAAAERNGVEVLVGSDQCKTVASYWKGDPWKSPTILESPRRGTILESPRRGTGGDPWKSPTILESPRRGTGGDPLIVDFHRPARGAAEVVRAVRTMPVAGIVPVGEAEALVAALAAAELGMPHNPPSAAAAARNKHAMRRALALGKVPQPSFCVLPLQTTASDVLGRIELPCVCKPLLLSASRGVIRASNAQELTAAIDRVRGLLLSPELFKYAGRASRQILIESFVPGAEVAVEGMVWDGELQVLAIFDKPDPLDGPFFEETLYVTPSRHPEPVQQAITRVTAEAARALGVRGGPVHVELRLSPEGPKIIEVALRTIGGLCSRAMRFGTGLSLEDLVIRHALGQSGPVPRRELRASGVMMLPIPRAGILRSVGGIDQARAVCGIEDVVISIGIGRMLVPLPEGNEYLGFLFARGDSPSQVEAALRQAHGRLRFDIAPVVSHWRAPAAGRQ